MKKEIYPSGKNKPEASDEEMFTGNLIEQTSNFLSMDYALVQLLPYDNTIQQFNSAA